MRLRYVEEPRPLGTGGALKFAEPLLDERFLMLNGDVLSDIDVSAQVARHEAAGARATLTLTPVPDPSAYGLVRTAADGQVTAFVEKPAPDQVDARTINAGIYVLERDVLDLLETGRGRLDRARRLPAPGRARASTRTSGDGYWRDIGTPAGYLEGTCDILEGTVRTEVQERMGEGFLCVEERVESAGRIVPAALVESGCRIGEGARVGGRAVLEHDVTIGANTTVERAVVMRGAEIGANCTLRNCIVAGGVRVGDGTRVEGLAVLGEGVTIGAGNVVANGARDLPRRDHPRRRAALLVVATPPRASRSEPLTWTRSTRPPSRRRHDGPDGGGAGPRHAPARRAVARRLGRARARRRPGGLVVAGHGRLRRRRAPRRRRARAAPDAPAAARHGLRAAARDRAGARSCCARPTRATRRRPSRPTTPRRPRARRGSWPPRAARWPPGRAPTACPWSRCPAASSRAPRSATRS